MKYCLLRLMVLSCFCLLAYYTRGVVFKFWGWRESDGVYAKEPC